MINNIHYHLSGVLFLPHHSQLETRTFDGHEKEQTEERRRKRRRRGRKKRRKRKG